MKIPFSTLLGCPLRPDQRAARAVLAAVFDLDVTPKTKLTRAQVVAVLAHKLLSDVGVDKDGLLMILRFFRTDIEGWRWAQTLLLSLNDNRYAMLVGLALYPRIYDYKMGVEVAKGPAPLLQASVNLSGLLALAEGTGPSGKPSRSGAGASSAGR